MKLFEKIIANTEATPSSDRDCDVSNFLTQKSITN